ncbi:hypothetical protein BDW69DRAFT_201877 [Aspergillus filifer]
MSSKSSLLESLSSTKDAQIALLQSFVRAPSPNPPGDTVQATKILTDYLSSQNIPYTLLAPPGRESSPNLVSQFTGLGGPGPRVILNGHIDVFPVDEATRSQWTRDPWSGDIGNGRIHGRGVVDMKSGTASLVLAYAALYAVRNQIEGSVALCAVSDEETGGKYGTQYLLDLENGKEKWGGDVMLSTEPSGQTIRFSEKGTLRITTTVQTRGAHGAYLNLSKGAIRTATTFISLVIPAIESLPTNPPQELSHYLSDPAVLTEVDCAMGHGTSTIIARPTVNIGTITGGVKVNMIPDSCTFELDIRLPVGLVAETVMKVLEDIARRAEFNDARIEFHKQEAASNPASYSSLNHPLVSLIQQAAVTPGVGDRRPIAIPSMGATDCKHYRYRGVPAFVYGCSPLTMASVDESASVDEFLHVTKVMAFATWDFLASKSG